MFFKKFSLVPRLTWTIHRIFMKNVVKSAATSCIVLSQFIMFGHTFQVVYWFSSGKSVGTFFTIFWIKYVTLFLSAQWVLKLNHQSQWSSLRKKCRYSELLWSAFSRIRTRTTPNTDTFHSVVIHFKFQRRWMDCDSYVQSKYAVVFFKMQMLISGLYITDQQEVGFRFFWVRAERKIWMLSRYFRF